MESHFRYSMDAPAVSGRKRKVSSSGSLDELSVKDDTCKVQRVVIISPQCTSTSPAEYALQVFQENGYDVVKDPSILRVVFTAPTESHIAAYRTDTVRIAQAGNVEQLRNLHQSGVSLDCCNRFGESLISMACRRGNVDVVRFLVLEAKVSLLLIDDFGRTVLHDAFWTTEPKLELVAFLLQIVPDLLCVKDVRGHAPLNYIRSEHWDKWNEFLAERRHLLRLKLSERNHQPVSTCTQPPSASR